MPKVEGHIEGQPVTVLRDTDYTTIITRCYLVPLDKMTSKTVTLYRLDRKKLHLPQLEVLISCPINKGRALVASMAKRSLTAVVTANADGV